MLKVLMKKQLLETLAFFLQGKNGKRRSNGALIGFAVLMVYAFGAVGAMFWMMSEMLCKPLVSAGLAWVYFSFMALIATCFGVIGGIFMAKTKLYEAKDNDLLLSMPIPAWTILFTRMIGLYLFTFLFESLVFVPALIQYYLVAGVSALSLLNGVLILFVMPFGALALCCALGFLLAWVTAKLPFKNLITIIGFVAFMVGYFIVYSKMQQYLTYVIANGDNVASTMKTVLYPFSQVGHAATGNMLALLLFLLIFGGLFAAVYAVISVTYLRTATMKKGERRVEYKGREQKVSSPKTALFKRELWRFVKSPIYMLNASMGTFIMVIMGVMMAIYGDLFGISKETLEMMTELSNRMVLLISLIVCFMASSNTLAACSISLEGENIGLIRSLPVKEWDILQAKLYLHIFMTALPAAICGAAMALIVEVVWWEILLVVATALISSAMFAVIDLAVNLKFPNLHWTNETAAIKQSLSVVIAMFGGWGISLLPLGGYFLFGKYLPSWGYAAICLSLFVVATAAVSVWLYQKGTKIFKTLSA
ncbi:MAG: hypothetical protein IJ284_05400 [Clostridia bacterium]|nr:hypothetical protein [Clostridia bacterium]